MQTKKKKTLQNCTINPYADPSFLLGQGRVGGDRFIPKGAITGKAGSYVTN